jgi:hypothetical protein
VAGNAGWTVSCFTAGVSKPGIDKAAPVSQVQSSSPRTHSPDPGAPGSSLARGTRV